MNERIKELAERATIIGEPGYPDSKFEYFDKEKFAKLLIRECADIINHRADTSADYLDSNKANDHARQVQRDCATTIKQHFGVE